MVTYRIKKKTEEECTGAPGEVTPGRRWGSKQKDLQWDDGMWTEPEHKVHFLSRYLLNFFCCGLFTFLKKIEF